ncbi:carboxypeptidase-like regulatory domain-containing protein [Marinifilum caeruleilacunae]|uniref:Carboxypeptidase-like regulatory domain-containing protein n=1 Tax=Marinifilum caeruleilacunae TaxID=2499076 RepID=A0ABX1X0T4_9BACT|nr:carboxypeptidase-like regulatory domain-containing protein [Marinifilum caeruleilacunae]NOU62007.1 carboxypeptidase-like regulatory domain-containing protein [Marinifilum caeruleilacunae]
MKIKTVLILFLMLSLQVKGQKETNITGKVIDQKTQESLPYATVIYQNKSIGTITDLNGNFTLSITDASETDSIFISYMGYESIKTVIAECSKTNQFELKPNINKLNEVIVTSKKFKLKKFIEEVIGAYNKNKREKAHIAIAHYREKAKEDNRYVMYMESIGYSVYAGTQANAAPLSNYKFFNENTRCHVSHPKWMKYNEHRDAHNGQNVIPAGGSNLNMFRYFEINGLLSNNESKKYKYQIDSSYYIQNNPIYCIRFNGSIAQGSLHVNAESKQILKIECSTSKYWSTAFHKRVDAQIKIQFNYFEKTPFLSKITATYEHEKLEYQNHLEVLIQKFNDFELNKEEYWSMNAYEQNPYIEYIPTAWETNIIEPDNDYSKIAADLGLNTTSLEKHFTDYSGRWFFSNVTRNELAVSKIKQLKKNF